MRKIIEKKLGRHNADGLAYVDTGLTVIDPRLPPRKGLRIEIHESLHHAYPKMSESEVQRGARIICNDLWSRDYRRVKQ
jgi:hypothetical protein